MKTREREQYYKYLHALNDRQLVAVYRAAVHINLTEKAAIAKRECERRGINTREYPRS